MPFENIGHNIAQVCTNMSGIRFPSLHSHHRVPSVAAFGVRLSGAYLGEWQYQFEPSSRIWTVVLRTSYPAYSLSQPYANWRKPDWSGIHRHISNLQYEVCVQLIPEPWDIQYVLDNKIHSLQTTGFARIHRHSDSWRVILSWFSVGLTAPCYHVSPPNQKAIGVKTNVGIKLLPFPFPSATEQLPYQTEP